ncbi:MAG: nitrogenase cofactor biosynthesis protein NifB [Betaproteobacteria bacterium]|nr:nitrogenase cofactor biosynthesis protein NifB [Betaproteobacteria bacterium]
MVDHSTEAPGNAGAARRRVFQIVPQGAPKGNGGGCGTKGGGGKTGCAAAGPGDLPPALWERIKDHPCYSEEAHHHFARMHVAVAPACNIQCNYCNRKYDCANESRPGVVSEKLTPEQAARKVIAVAARIPQLSVVGIAGPGDALANAAKTLRTFELIQQAAPDIKLCFSTNGLSLPDHVDAIKRFNVDHVTVTVNMVDPEVGARIYPWIYFRNRRWSGTEAARILSERQLEGLKELTAAGVLVKVNSVMIPGINDEHLVEVNRAVKARGAFLHNIMPLISDPAHGTHFGLTGQLGPTPAELKALQDRCEGEIQVMRHCRQCRADAVGLLGEDLSADFTLAKLDAEPAYNPGARRAYREFVEKERADQRAAREQELKKVAGAWPGLKIQVAVATKGSGCINQHFGHASEFQIYEVSAAGARFVGHRKIDHYCLGGYEDDEAMPSILEALNGCAAVLVAKVGHCPRRELEQAGIEAVEDYAHEYIGASALRYFERYLARLKQGAAAGAA